MSETATAYQHTPTGPAPVAGQAATVMPHPGTALGAAVLALKRLAAIAPPDLAHQANEGLATSIALHERSLERATNQRAKVRDCLLEQDVGDNGPFGGYTLRVYGHWEPRSRAISRESPDDLGGPVVESVTVSFGRESEFDITHSLDAVTIDSLERQIEEAVE